jgi:hypothetical protein
METYSFVLTEQDANIIIGALAKQPFEVVVNLIQKLQTQAEKQRNAKEIMEVAAGTTSTELPSPAK